MSNTYGVLSSIDSGYTDTSLTLRGAKIHATRNGYTKVYIRFANGYNIERVARKVDGKWINS